VGSTAAEGLPRIGRTSIATRWRSCGLPQSASCSENFVIPPDVFGQTLTDSFFQRGGDWGTPEAFTLTPGPRKASTDSFLNHRPLELGKHAHHLKHRLPAGCRGVEALLPQE